NLHMIFYRNMCAAALDLAPDQALEAITDIVCNFQMPGAGMPDWRRNGVLMAKHGIYDLRQHLEDVVMPVLRKWNVFDRNDFTPRCSLHGPRNRGVDRRIPSRRARRIPDRRSAPASQDARGHGPAARGKPVPEPLISPAAPAAR